ncbi:MAG TPA: bifunctional 5,10-methylenetetrahydrofolate dehydrogenase/5,10-methenyltetrahydrofolate cyclohydrolase [Bacteriovoracaceae bacterium]|nr:bifunctional 5,10-methylenetetrahydrofolate dehydrogenase/5,10-methenyltetrahydrofolate cyclohydrolase [Bacteriovoracaceae bacterium]
MISLNSKEVKSNLISKLRQEVESLSGKHQIVPGLAVVLVGDDPASAVYVKNKIKTCAELGINSIQKILPHTTSQTELLAVIEQLNSNPEIHGILCQIPLPRHLNEEEIIHSITPLKDVDCFHPFNLGLLVSGTPRYIPCTPFGILQILKYNQIAISGKNVVILGRGHTVGRPLSILLSAKGLDATVTLCHSKSTQVQSICKSADILIAAIGIPKLVNRDYVKAGATVIDVGINRISDGTASDKMILAGDVDFDDIKEIAYAATPVPGGVGPMTITMLMANTINAARINSGLLPITF